jgi:hypothetical protein
MVPKAVEGAVAQRALGALRESPVLHIDLGQVLPSSRFLSSSQAVACPKIKDFQTQCSYMRTVGGPMLIVVDALCCAVPASRGLSKKSSSSQDDRDTHDTSPRIVKILLCFLLLFLQQLVFLLSSAGSPQALNSQF